MSSTRILVAVALLAFFVAMSAAIPTASPLGEDNTSTTKSTTTMPTTKTTTTPTTTTTTKTTTTTTPTTTTTTKSTTTTTPTTTTTTKSTTTTTPTTTTTTKSTTTTTPTTTTTTTTSHSTTTTKSTTTTTTKSTTTTTKSTTTTTKSTTTTSHSTTTTTTSHSTTTTTTSHTTTTTTSHSTTTTKSTTTTTTKSTTTTTHTTTTTTSHSTTTTKSTTTTHTTTTTTTAANVTTVSSTTVPTLPTTTTTALPAGDFNGQYPEMQPSLRARFVSLSFKVDETTTVTVCKEGTDGCPATDAILGNFITDVGASADRKLALTFRAADTDSSVTLGANLFFDGGNFSLSAVKVSYSPSASANATIINATFTLENFQAEHAYQCSSIASDTSDVTFTDVAVQGGIPADNNGRFSTAVTCPHDASTTSTTTTASTTTASTTTASTTTAATTATGAPTTPAGSKKKPLSTGAVVGVSIVCLVLVGGGVAYFLRLRQKKLRKHQYGILTDDTSYSTITE